MRVFFVPGWVVYILVKRFLREVGKRIILLVDRMGNGNFGQ